jgi:integrase
LLKALETEPLKHKLLVYLALATGLRRGELMGLEWKDINFAQSTLEVRQCSQYLPGKGSFTKDPKNELSQRVIAIPHSVMAMLKQFKKQQAEERLKVGDLWQGSDRIFTTWDGQPAHPEWPSQWFSKFIKKHGLPHLTFHGLRHTSATMLIGQGVNMKEVSSRLGHSNISTTMDIYADSLKSADKDAAEKMDLFLNSIKQPAN